MYICVRIVFVCNVTLCHMYMLSLARKKNAPTRKTKHKKQNNNKIKAKKKKKTIKLALLAYIKGM